MLVVLASFFTNNRWSSWNSVSLIHKSSPRNRDKGDKNLYSCRLLENIKKLIFHVHVFIVLYNPFFFYDNHTGYCPVHVIYYKTLTHLMRLGHTFTEKTHAHAYSLCVTDQSASRFWQLDVSRSRRHLPKHHRKPTLVSTKSCSWRPHRDTPRLKHTKLTHKDKYLPISP